MKSQQIPTGLRTAVMYRDGNSCRMCGQSAYERMGPSVHHRINRGAGGTTRVPTLAELVLLCGTGTTGCHGLVSANPKWAYETGWSIRRTSPDDPEEVPLTDAWGYQFFLTSDGDVVRIGNINRSKP